MLLINSITIVEFVNLHCRAGKKRALDYFFFLTFFFLTIASYLQEQELQCRYTD